MDKDNDILIDSFDERIESFLRGTMTVEEESAFKEEIRHNPELRNRTKAMTSLVRGLRAKNTALEESIIKKNTSKSRVRPILWWACSVAAVFAIFFSIYKDRRYKMLEATVSPYYTEYDMSDISRGDVDSVTLVHLYTLFSQIQENRSMSSIIKELDSIYQSLDDDYTYHPWANDIAWNLALAYIKDDDIKKAIPILEKLKGDNPDMPIAVKSKEILENIEGL